MKNVQTKHIDSFKDTAQYIFDIDRYALLKEKHIRFNQVAFINTKLRKAIMTRSRLLNKVTQERTTLSHVAYNKLRNICVKLIRKTEKDFFNNLDVKHAKNNTQFW